MVKHTLHLDNIFHSLSDPTRREILLRIASSNDLTVSQIARPYNMSLPAISKHLRVLESARLIQRKQRGKEYVFTFTADPLKTVEAYLSFYTKFWENHNGQAAYFLSGEK